MPRHLVESIAEQGVEQYETEDLEEVIGEANGIYVTRVQKERFKPEHGLFKARRAKREYKKVKDAYVIDKNLMSLASLDSVLEHPLPRVNEIAFEVDDDERAGYFDQVESGMYIRMGLLALLAGRTILSGAGVEVAARRTMIPWMMASGRNG